ncbi:MAG: sensor histidine kinase, partial [Tissierella sp.]|nr:sensor histidine kinase [Tissierella sp.]
MRLHLKLRTKIMLYTIIIIVSAIIFVMTFFYIWAIDDLEDNISKHNMNIAMNLGNYPHFGDLLQEEDPNRIIQNYTYQQLEDMENVDMLVVANMEGKRFSHPRADRLGKYFVGGDEKRVIEHGEHYISFEEGTLGQSLRAFAPIHNSHGEQVGFIMVGTLLEGIKKTQRLTLVRLLIYSLGGLILGIAGSIILSGNIKKSLLGLEPYQISMLYTEKNSMLETI